MLRRFRRSLRSRKRVQDGCATESGGMACRRRQTDFPMGAIGSRYPTRRGRRGRPACMAGPSGNVGEAGGHARLPGRCVEAGQLAMRLHDAAGRGRPSPGAAIARPGRTRRRRPVRPATGWCGTAHRHAPSRHPADGCGSGTPQKTSADRVALRPMERGPQLPHGRPVTEWKGPFPARQSEGYGGSGQGPAAGSGVRTSAVALLRSLTMRLTFLA